MDRPPDPPAAGGPGTPETSGFTIARPELRPPRLDMHDIRLFASARDEQRLRRPLDAVTAVLALALLAVLGWWAQPTRSFERSLTAAATSSPGWLHNLWVMAYDLVSLLAVGALVAIVVRRRWPLLVQCAVAGASALALVVVVARANTGEWASVEHAIGLGNGVVWPSAGITIASAVLLALAADVTAPARSVGVWAISIAAVAAVLSGRSTPTGVMAALLAAIAASAVARLAAGTAAGRVSRSEALELLHAVGVGHVEIERFSRQGDGVVLIEARADDGKQLLVKVLGRDVAEQRRLLRLWRSLIYRDGSAALALGRVPGVEREALATLLAEVHDVPVWRVLTMARGSGSDQTLVLVIEGVRAAGLPAGSLGAAFAASAWRTVQALHAARFAHLDLGPRSIALREDGTVALTDFTDATAVQNAELFSTDNAQLLTSLAVLTDPACAVESARAALDDEQLEGLLPFLQPAALPGDLRRAAKVAGLDIESLRAETAETAGVEVPRLAPLRRITLGSLVRSGLLVLAAWAIISYFSQLDFDELRAAFEDASVPLLVTGLVFAQLPRFTQAMSTLGSVPARLPYGPVYVMQLATNFLNVALPSATARAALSIRFFQRQGVPPATALVSGLIDSFVGNVVQAILLGALLLFSDVSLELETEGSTTGSVDYRLFVAVAVACVLAVAVVLVSGRVREQVMSRARAWWPDLKAGASTLRARRKLFQLLVGSVATELLFAITLALFVHAFGTNISLIDALFVNLTTSLIVMFIPIPGGIGVAEGALVIGLTGLGVDQDVAFASAISYRIATFYLPPIWGWVAMRWLQNKGYI